MQLLSTGLVLDTLDEIIDGFNQAELSGIASTLNLNAPDPIAVMNGVVAERLQSLEELAGAMYSGMQPDNASGDGLTGLALITGTTREPATATIVVCTCTFTGAVTYAPGTLLASVAGAPYYIYQNAETASTVGPGTASVTFECTTTGPNPVSAGTLTQRVSSQSDWTGVTNPAAGIAGQDIQTDASLRLAQRQELALGGSTSAAAIAADILAFLQPSHSPLTIPGIETSATGNPFTLTAATISVTVLYNDTDITSDATGLPPHSIEAIVYAPGATTSDDRALCALLLADKAAGIQTYSGAVSPVSESITDDQGLTTTVLATRPSVLATDIDVTVKAKSGHTVDVTEVRNAIMAYIAGTLYDGTPIDNATANWTPGATAYASSIVGAIFSYDIAGVADVTGVVLSSANSGANIVPSVREIVGVNDASTDIHVTIV